MVFKGFLFILLIILSTAFLILSLVMMIIKFGSNNKAALKWLAGAVAGLVVLLFSVYTIMNGVVNKAREIGGKMGEFAKEQGHKMDSLSKAYSNSNDSILDSPQVAYLMTLEPDSMKGRVPEQFYSYLGFRDYYRLPLMWPYSLHCMDSLGDAGIYDERSVQQFDMNDNGERSCEFHGIMNFAFNKEYMVGMRINIENKPRKQFFAFHFQSVSWHLFKTESEMVEFARQRGFNVSELKSCKAYYNEF